MPPSFCPPLQSVLFGILAFALTAAADQVIPPSILEPRSAAEAWNVIRLVTRNVDQLLEEQRLPEIPNQISFCSPALRTLPRFVDQPAAVAALEKLLPRAFVSVNAIAGAAMDKNPIGSGAALASLRTMLDQAAVHFDAKTVRGDIFICPMHPDVLSADAQAPCTKCGMGLLTRRIPYSFIYTKPGEPSIRLKAAASVPIEAGKRISVKVRANW